MKKKIERKIEEQTTGQNIMVCPILQETVKVVLTYRSVAAWTLSIAFFLHLIAAVLYNALSSSALDSFQRFHRMAFCFLIDLM